MNNYILKRPGEHPIIVQCKDFDDIRAKLIPDDPKNGIVQAVPIMLDFWLLCDEEARIKKNPPKINIKTDMVVGEIILGNVMIVLEKDGNWVSIPETMMPNMMQWLDNLAV